MANLGEAFGCLANGGEVPLDELAAFMEKSTKTVRRYVDEFSDMYFVENSIVKRRS